MTKQQLIINVLLSPFLACILQEVIGNSIVFPLQQTKMGNYSIIFLFFIHDYKEIFTGTVC